MSSAVYLSSPYFSSAMPPSAALVENDATLRDVGRNNSPVTPRRTKDSDADDKRCIIINEVLHKASQLNSGVVQSELKECVGNKMKTKNMEWVGATDKNIVLAIRSTTFVVCPYSEDKEVDSAQMLEGTLRVEVRW